MESEKKQQLGIYSKVIRAGRRRTYFFDVRTTKSNEYYLTVTESKKRFDSDSYEKHKVHVYKEDFHKFIEAVEDVVSHIKGLMPDYDYDEFARPVQTIEYDENGVAIKNEEFNYSSEPAEESQSSSESTEDVIESSVDKNTEAPKVDDDDLKWD